MIENLDYRRGTFCLTYGHHWQPTSKPGRYQCSNCQAIGYCPGCLLTIPKDALTLQCEQHQERKNR